ncbi:integrase core domain-containing protein [Nonomuraea sp. NPDC003560]|uniref:integrase core domain-containing protein n=1 Tax=Nonomuraea sp. NPDC003560 TaxID=3364341 RepID=UPI0036A48F3E
MILPRASRAHAFAERWVRTARTECANRLLILGERHLRTMLDEYADHYNRDRPTHYLGLRAPTDDDSDGVEQELHPGADHCLAIRTRSGSRGARECSAPAGSGAWWHGRCPLKPRSGRRRDDAGSKPAGTRPGATPMP